MENVAGKIKYLNGKNEKYLTLIANDLKVITWYLNVSFAVHRDFKNHIRVIMTMVQGAMKSVYRETKLNTWNSAEAALVIVSDTPFCSLWTVLFI